MAPGPCGGHRSRRGRAGSLTIKLRRLLPGAAVLGAVLAVLVLGGDELPGFLTEGYALVLYGVGIALGAWFHRSRVVAAILGLGLLDLFGARIPGGEEYLLALGAVALLLLGLLTLPGDRGIFSPGGLAQIGILVAAAAPPALVLRDPGALEVFMEMVVVPVEVLPWNPGVPQLIVALGSGGLVLAAAGLYRRTGPVEMGLAWCLPLVAAGVYPGFGTEASSLFLMGAALILGISVLETSYHMAYRDELTGLPGRRALLRDLGELRGTFTVAMADVDHFKTFNDRHGHEVGDQVLKLVATRLGRVGGGGRAYRYGGEEFTLLFPGKDREAAETWLEKVRAGVEGARFTLRAWNRPKRKPRKGAGSRRKGKRRNLSVTISIGVGDSSGPESEPDAVLKKADEALYRAKKKGRNQVSA